MIAKNLVVATNIGVILKIVQNNVTGMLVPLRDANALAEALEQLLIDKKLRLNMGQKGYNMAYSLTSEKAAQKVAKVCRSLV